MRGNDFAAEGTFLLDEDGPAGNPDSEQSGWAVADAMLPAVSGGDGRLFDFGRHFLGPRSSWTAESNKVKLLQQGRLTSRKLACLDARLVMMSFYGPTNSKEI